MKLNNEVWITVHANGSVEVEILFHCADSPERIHFSNWKHCLASYGSMFALMDCRMRINGTYQATEPIDC